MCNISRTKGMFRLAAPVYHMALNKSQSKYYKFQFQHMYSWLTYMHKTRSKVQVLKWKKLLDLLKVWHVTSKWGLKFAAKLNW